MALTKPELRRLYPPVPDGGAAARRVVEEWNTLVLRPQSPLGAASRCVFCYIGGPDECATAPILCFCLRHGIPLAVPLCEGRGVMTARRVTSFSGFRRGRFGIVEPPGDAPVMDAPHVTIVPGLAFDRDGYRLGRGGGYYDRWLVQNPCRTIGLCPPGRLLERLPRESWDVPVQTVVTGM